MPRWFLCIVIKALIQMTEKTRRPPIGTPGVAPVFLRVGGWGRGRRRETTAATVMSQRQPPVSASPTYMGVLAAGYPLHHLQPTSHHLTPLLARGALFHLQLHPHPMQPIKTEQKKHWNPLASELQKWMSNSSQLTQNVSLTQKVGTLNSEISGLSHV